MGKCIFCNIFVVPNRRFVICEQEMGIPYEYDTRFYQPQEIEF